MDMSQQLAKKIPDPRFRIELLKTVHHEKPRAWGSNSELVLSVIEVESNFNRFAISSAGARGLMQVMPFWLKEIGRPGDSLIHMQTNLRYGCTILKYLPRQGARQAARGAGALQRQPGPGLVSRPRQPRLSGSAGIRSNTSRRFNRR